MSDASWNGKVAELKVGGSSFEHCELRRKGPSQGDKSRVGIGTAVQSGPATSVVTDATWNGKVTEVKVNGRVFEHVELRQKTPDMEERSKVLGDFAITLDNGAFEIITKEIIGISWRNTLAAEDEDKKGAIWFRAWDLSKNKKKLLVIKTNSGNGKKVALDETFASE